MSLTVVMSREAMLGTVLFTSVSAAFVYSVKCSSGGLIGSCVGSRGLSTGRVGSAKSLSPLEAIKQIEERVQRDEGKRGIKELILPGELLNAANDCLNARNIVIITGFPCLVDFTPPTETDGPLGALAIARSLLSLGTNKVSLLTDECNEEVMLAATAASGLFEKYKGRFNLESFPGLPEFDESDQSRLNKIADNTDLLIAIERAGPSNEGTYLTMRAIDMSHIVAPLDDIISRRARNSPERVVFNDRCFRSIGIGGRVLLPAKL
jgi:hypothetical protein